MVPPAAGATYRAYALRSDPVDCDLPLTAEAAAARPYPADAPPVFFGHYWLSDARPRQRAPNVACLDYSVPKGGFLCAYRWDGEWVLDPAKSVTVSAVVANIVRR